MNDGVERDGEKVLKSLFVITAFAGYTIGLLYVFNNTSFSPDTISGFYRGDEAAMRFEKSYVQLLETSHNHLLGMGMLFFLIGGMFARTRLRFPLRNFLVAEPAAGLLVMVACIWLVRFVSPSFSWLMLFSSTLMCIGFYMQCFLVLYDLWRKSRHFGITARS